MRRQPKHGGTVLPMLLLAAAAVCAQPPPPAAGIEDALTGGRPQLALRYRFEHVDQDDFAEDANASTLRVRLNYATGSWQDWSAFAEFDYVGELFLRDFNSGGGTSPDRMQYPLVADPDGADLNQLYLDYSVTDSARLRFGRQRIIFDNHRFVGNVGWRQNEQTYDGFSVEYESLPRTKLTYAYVYQVNRVLGERSPQGRDDGDTHLLNAAISLPDGWTLSPYVYYIDSDDTPAFSTATLGARLTGRIPAGTGSIALTGDFATQSEAGNAPVDYRAGYLHAAFAWSPIEGLSLGLAWESLGGDDAAAGAAFRTPLATLYAFQGWADQFVLTPDAGVDDVYATVGYRYAAWDLQAAYHDFAAESGSAGWGEEIDLSVGRNLGERYAVLFKAAFFDAADSAFVDVTKLWLMLTASF